MLRRAVCVLLAGVTFSLGGCTQIIQKTSATDSEAIEELDDGEVYYHFEENPEIEPQELSDEPSTCPLSQSKIDALSKNVDEVIAQYPDFAGTVLLGSGNRIIYEKSFGKTGVRKNDNENDTIYQIGSVTKQFTGTAIMDLIKEGKISPSDTLDKYFPEYETGKKITIDNLLHMRSGIPDYNNNPDPFWNI